MTRTHTRSPVWTWKCDSCGYEALPLARVQAGLPSRAAMESRGWFIAEKWGDKCPDCVLTGKEKNDE